MDAIMTTNILKNILAAESNEVFLAVLIGTVCGKLIVWEKLLKQTSPLNIPIRQVYTYEIKGNPME